MPGESEDSRRRGLIERILDLLIREGISSQTMEGIADKIGVSKRTLYKYFPGKELLFEIVVQHKLESIESQLIALQSSGKPYPERLIGFFIILERAIKPLASTLMIDIMRNAAWIWPKIDEFRHNRILIHLEALMNEGSDLGYLRADLNLKVVSPVYIAIIEQIGRPDFMMKQAIPPSEVLNTLINIVLGGILSEKGHRLFEDSGKEVVRHE
jgi:AcrR family transcriptional regulator